MITYSTIDLFPWFCYHSLATCCCFRVRPWPSCAPRCPTSRCLGSLRVSNTQPSGTPWLTSLTETSITRKKSKSRELLCLAVDFCGVRSANYTFVVADLITSTVCRCYLLPYLFLACSRSPWQHAAQLREQRIAGWWSALAALEQLNQLQQSIITMYIPFTAQCAVSEMSWQTC